MKLALQLTSLACAAAMSLSASSVFAQTSYTKDNYPQQMNKRPLTLAEGQGEVTGDITFGLDNENAFKRIHITPDFYYGINKEFTVGISHHAFATPWNNALLNFRSVCIGDFCPKAYNSVSPDVKYSLVTGDFSLALQGGIDISSFSPDFVLGLRVGAIMRVRAGDSFFLDAAPSFRIGVIGRNSGGKEAINLPVRASYQVSKELAPFVETGITAPLDGFGDFLLVPLGVGANVAVAPNIDVGGAFRLPALLSGSAYSNLGAFDFRELGVFGAVRF